MARKKSGGFNKFLNFIGLVDDEDTRDTYGEEYSGDNYGRRQPYTPPQQRNRPTGRQADRRRLPAEPAPRSRFDDGRSSRTSEGYDDYRASARPSARYEEDRYSRPQPRSRYEEPRTRYGSSSQLPAERQPARRAMQVSRRTRTVMYSLRTLKDCCKVIDELIANNTVVLTMEEMDGSLMQRALDTLSGAAFALNANIRKASDRTYLVAPTSVDVNAGYEEVEDYDY